MINNITMSTTAVRPQHAQTPLQIARSLGDGLGALRDFWQQITARTAYRRERHARAQIIRLCSDRIKMKFDMPSTMFLADADRKAGRRHALSVAEIVGLYHNPATREYFDREIAEAIDAYVAAKKHYRALRLPEHAG